MIKLINIFIFRKKQQNQNRNITQITPGSA